MANFIIEEEFSSHKYRTELPNIIFEIGLKGLEIAVYAAIKRAAGDHGACTKSYDKLAKSAGVCKRVLFSIIPKLCEINPFIKKPLLICSRRITENGDQDTNLLTIVSIWPENVQMFNGGGAPHASPHAYNSPPSAKFALPHASNAEGVVHHMHEGGAPHAHKEEPFKKNHIKKNKQRQGVVVDFFYDCLEKEQRLTAQDKQSLMQFPEDRVKLALDFSLKVVAKKDLISQLMWHCQQTDPPIPKESKPIEKKVSFRDQVKQYFKNGEMYNGATCYIDANGINLERGEPNIVSFKDSNFQDNFMAIVTRLKIKWAANG